MHDTKKRFYITDKDIREGVRSSAKSCPIARCLQRAFPNDEVRVRGLTIDIGQTSRMSPERVRIFVQQFDRGLNVKRTSFELKI